MQCRRENVSPALVIVLLYVISFCFCFGPCYNPPWLYVVWDVTTVLEYDHFGGCKGAPFE